MLLALFVIILTRFTARSGNFSASAGNISAVIGTSNVFTGMSLASLTQIEADIRALSSAHAHQFNLSRTMQVTHHHLADRAYRAGMLATLDHLITVSVLAESTGIAERTLRDRCAAAFDRGAEGVALIGNTWLILRTALPEIGIEAHQWIVTD